MQTILEIHCKQCQSSNTTRSTRKTFFERVILLRLGLHPWKCLTCKHRFFTRVRGSRKQDARASAERHSKDGDNSQGATQGIILK
jgi:hypothetical protein